VSGVPPDSGAARVLGRDRHPGMSIGE